MVFHDLASFRARHALKIIRKGFTQTKLIEIVEYIIGRFQEPAFFCALVKLISYIVVLRLAVFIILRHGFQWRRYVATSGLATSAKALVGPVNSSAESVIDHRRVQSESRLAGLFVKCAWGMPEGALGIETFEGGTWVATATGSEACRKEVGNPGHCQRGCLSAAMDPSVRGYPIMIGCQWVCSIDLASNYPRRVPYGLVAGHVAQ